MGHFKVSREKFSLIFLLLFIVFTSLFFLPSNAFSAKKYFVIAFQGDAATLDAHGRNETTTISIQSHIYDTLIFNDIDGSYKPSLAVSWKPINKTEWIFRLRKNVRFHNGDPFDSQVAIDSILRAKGVGFKRSQMKHYTKGIKKLSIIDKYSFKINTGKPWPSLPAEIASIRMVPVSYIKKVGNAKFARFPIGTGAYKFVKWIKDDYIELIANENWWKGSPEIKNVRIRPIPVNAARTAGLLSGEIDVVWGVAPVDGAKLIKNKNLNVFKTITQRTIYLTFDQWRQKGGTFKKGGKYSPGIEVGKTNPFMKLKVRKAISHAINVPQLLQTIMHGSGKPATHLNPPFAFGYNKTIRRLPYSPSRAKKLLKEAGFPNGFKTRLDCPNDRYINDGPMCLAIAGMLTKVGIKTTPNPRPKAVFFKKMSAGDHSMYMAGWGTDQVFTTFSAAFHTRIPGKGFGRINRGRYSNKWLDKHMMEAAVEMNNNKRKKMWEKAWKTVIDDVAFLPLYQQTVIIATQKNVHLVPRVNEWVLAQEISIKK